MSITVPRPPYPGGSISRREVVTGKIDEYATDGTSVSKSTPYSNDLEITYGARGDMTRTKLRVLAPSQTLWRPVTSYWTGCGLVTPVLGKRADIRKSTGRLGRVVEGPALDTYQADYGAHVFSSNLKIKPMGTNTVRRLNTEVMVKVGAKKASYGEALAESRQTVNHLAKSVRSLAMAYSAARRGNWAGVARALEVPVKRAHVGRSASSKWLEYQYAWLPLMGDAYDSYELFKHGLRKEAQIASSTRSLKDIDSYDVGPTTGRNSTRGRSVRTDFIKVFYRINDSDLSALHQLGLINPLSIAWELVPYSFVVDWFVPVGSVLEALTARFGVTFIDGYRGSTVESDVTVVPRYVDDAVFRTASCSQRTRTQVSAFTRTKLNSFPLPAPYFKSPFSTTHLLSALALVRQLWR